MHLLQELVQPRAVDEVLAPSPYGWRPRTRPSGSAGSLEIMLMTSIRKPSTPRSSHQRIIAYTACADLGVLPVEVGLLAAEQVQVVLAGRPRPAPRSGRRRTTPSWSARRPGAPGLHAEARRPPPVPVALRVVPGRAGLDEPRVLVRGVVDDQVHDQLHPALVHGRQQPVEVGQRAEGRVDVLVVADVVAAVVPRRRVDRGQPDHVDAERRPGSPASTRCRPGRRCRRRRSRRSCAGRSGRRRRSSTTARARTGTLRRGGFRGRAQ